MTDSVALAVSHVSKTFGVTRALDDVSLSFRSGQVTALLGENGSGKSTLIKVLSGVYIPDQGASLRIAGKDVALPMPTGAFRDLGIAFVHQDLALVPDMTVVENMRVSSILVGGRGLVSWRSEAAKARKTFRSFGVDLNPSALVSDISPTQRALLAIIRAVEEIRAHKAAAGEQDPALLVLDEPTVFLPKEGTDLLFGLVRSLVGSGTVGVLFVSHDLDEVLEHTDRVTVFRDGKLQGTRASAELDRDGLIEMIVGRPLSSMALETTPVDGHAAELDSGAENRTILVSALAGGSVAGADIQLRPGEIVGITGLAGSGYDEVLPMLYGAVPAGNGSLSVDGTEIAVTRTSPQESLRRKIVYIPADRAKDGSVGDLSVSDNVLLPVLSHYMSARGLRLRAMTRRADELAETYDVRPRDVKLTYGTLSGGNQQKALLAKWLQTGPKLVLLQEPTQGVDVGARAHIFTMLGDAAAAGAAVLVASSDYEQLALICGRVLIFGAGRVASVLVGDQVTREHIADAVLNAPTSDANGKEIAA